MINDKIETLMEISDTLHERGALYAMDDITALAEELEQIIEIMREANI